MVYFRLGLTNAWRNLSRSAVALFSMAVAVGFLSYALLKEFQLLLQLWLSKAQCRILYAELMLLFTESISKMENGL